MVKRLDPVADLTTSFNSELPIAQRKARRAPTMDATTSQPVPVAPPNIISNPFQANILPPPPQTPKASKKRSRKSDPLPSLNVGPASGLTPSVKRIRLGRAVKHPPRRAPTNDDAEEPRRQTMPGRALSNIVDAPNGITEVQFAPIRQSLTPRTKRVLKRNHFSEEMNTVADERKTIAKQKEQIAQLEAQLVTMREEAAQAVQMHRTSPSFQRIQELESELGDVQEQLSASLSTPPRSTSARKSNSDPFLGPTSPGSTVAFEEDYYQKDFDMPLSPLTLNHQSRAPSHPSSPSPSINETNSNHIGLQTDLSMSKVRAIESFTANQKQFLIAARRELEDILPGETALPLTPTLDANVTPLVTALLTHLRTTKKTMAQNQAALATIERQERNLRIQFNASLIKVDTARSQVEELESALKKTTEVFRKERGRADLYFKEKTEAEVKLKDAQERLGAAEKDAADHEHDSKRHLKELRSCHRELAHLENLIMQVEEDHRKAVEKMKGEHLAAVGDLEQQIEAEMTARAEDEEFHKGYVAATIRGMDSELEDARAAVVLAHKQRERSREEMTNALNSKQAYVRDVEERLEAEQEAREREVGSLNAQLANTQTRVHEVKKRMKEERRRARHAITAIVQATQEMAAKAIQGLTHASDVSSDTSSSPESKDRQAMGVLSSLDRIEEEQEQYHNDVDMLGEAEGRSISGSESNFVIHDEGEVSGDVVMGRGRFAKSNKIRVLPNLDSGLGTSEGDAVGGTVDTLLSSEL